MIPSIFVLVELILFIHYKARTKFNSPIDSLQSAKQLLQVNTLQDYPRMIKKISQTDLKNFWMDEIQHFKKKALISLYPFHLHSSKSIQLIMFVISYNDIL